VRDFLGIGCVLRISGVSRFRKSAGEGFVNAVVDLAGINQVLAPAAANIDAVPLAVVERKTGDGQRLALGACLFGPIVPPPYGLSRTFDTTPSSPTSQA
jgi:hypothetical protein